MPYESPDTGVPMIEGDLLVPPPGMSRGYEERNWEAFPIGTFAEPFPLPVIPRSEWRDRIEFMDRHKLWPKDRGAYEGVKVKDQNGTNYCWIFGPTTAVEHTRASMGLPFVSLSPASAGGPIKNYRNVGGWGSEGLEYIIEHGLVPSSEWPDTAIDRRYDTPETRASREKYKVTEWWELQDRSLGQLVTCLLYGFAVAVGYNWWGHEICCVKAHIKGSDTFEIEIQNSWSTNWGQGGFGLLSEAKSIPDDAVAPRIATPSGE